MATTLLQALPYPASSAAANVPLDVQALAVSMESKGVQVYASSGARTSAFTAATLSPAAGMTSYLTGTKRMEIYDGTQWAPMSGQILSYHKRTSSKTFLAAGAELGVARLNSIALLGGYRYTICTSNLTISTVSGETGKASLRYSTSGTAGTSDTILGSVEANTNTAFRPVQTPAMAFTYSPGANVTFSVVLTILRSGGSGNVTMNGASDQPIELWIVANGPDTGDTGVDL